MWEGERRVGVRVRLPVSAEGDVASVGRLDVPVPSTKVGGGDSPGPRIALSALANMKLARGRTQINREQGGRFLAIKCNIEGRDMATFVEEAQARVQREVKLPEGMYMTWGGEFENQKRAMTRLSVIVPFSFLVVFALLYTALGSVTSAFTVLLVAPLAMSGGVFGLALAHIPLSVSAAVGFIALLGQVCLASLLVVSAVDDRRRRGEELVPALSHGAAARFRAVLMTAMLAILGLTPMAISTSVGSETQRPFAVVIISGLVTAVAVTLFVLPSAYSLIVRRVPAVEREDE